MIDKYLGKRLDGRYEIQELIGIGGMAMVYKAYDNIEDRTVAVKILKDEWLSNEEFRRRFKNESKAIAVLSHPNIVKVYDVSFGDLIQYIVMEYVDGITLKEYIEQQKVIRWQEAVHFTLQILRAISHAHDKGIIHRDLKPQNIMLLADGTIKVADFGIARFSKSEQRTMTEKAIGSVHYISPEQAKGEFTDCKSDIYSVGVMLYEMTTGSLPFEADSAVSVAIMQLQNEPVNPRKLNSSIPEGLEQITLKAMQKDTFNRYQSAGDMLNDLEDFRINPAITFDYDSSSTLSGGNAVEEPTKYINTADLKRKTEKNGTGEYRPSIDLHNKDGEEDEEEEEEGKSPVIPILGGITAAFVIILAIIAALFWDSLFGSTGTETYCPDLRNMKYTEAVEKYPEYEIKQESTQYSSDHEAGIIMSQTPSPNSKLKEANTIKVIVSLGPKSVTMDNYTEVSLATVTTRLNNLGFEYTTEEVYNETIATGYVVKTDPPADKSVPEGTKVIIYVSKGPVPVVVSVPNLLGLKVSDAQTKIEGYGLTVGNVTYSASETYPSGYVVSQSIPEGTDVSKGKAVDITVSSGKAVKLTVTGLPITDKSFVITAWYNNQLCFTSSKVSTKGKTEETASTVISLTKDMFDINASKVTVRLKADESTDLADYSIDFDNGTAVCVNQIYKYPVPEQPQDSAETGTPAEPASGDAVQQ